MAMQLTLRPYMSASVALLGAGLVAATPVTAPRPDVQVRAVQLASLSDSGLDGLTATAATTPEETLQQLLIAAIQQSETNFADNFNTGTAALATQLDNFGTQLDTIGTNLTNLGGTIDPILGAIYTDLGSFFGGDRLGALVQLSGTIVPFIAQPLYDIEIQEVNLGSALFDLLTGPTTAGAAADPAQLASLGDLSVDGLTATAATTPEETLQQLLIAAIQQSETNFADNFNTGTAALATQLDNFGTQLDTIGTNLTNLGGTIDPILGAIYTDLGSFFGADELGGLVQLSGTIVPFIAQPLYDIEIQEVNLGSALFDLLTGTTTATGAAVDIAPDTATGVSSLVADLAALF
jgi:hypothetical protein